MRFHLPELILAIATEVHSAGGRALLVGGSVRDQLLGYEPKDFDLEIFGIPEASIESVFGKVASSVVRCGRSFPVWKVWNETMSQEDAIDIAIPRREKSVGPGHCDFSYALDPSMPFEEAASRRDFTINAIGYDPLSHDLLDPFHGIVDIETRTLRHVGTHFVDDPLRVLRGAQFCARFKLTPAASLLSLCGTLSPTHLAKERIWEEFRKLLLKGIRPSLGLNFLRDADWTRFFPDLHAIIGVPQNPQWHPEGDVWEHTLHCLDAFAETRIGNIEEDLIVGLAVLCHDFGKTTSTVLEGGVWKAPGHEEAGVEPTKRFLSSLTAETDLINDVTALVETHMRPKLLRHDAAKHGANVARAIRRLSTKVRLDRLARVCYCDSAGRPPLPKHSRSAVWLLEQAEKLNVASEKPVPLVQGRDLIAAGKAPGPHFGPALKSAYEAQLDGLVRSHEEALNFAIRLLQGDAEREAL
jgi:tRNA nucleotidyltransferase (CCA-adding enzyme)